MLLDDHLGGVDGDELDIKRQRTGGGASTHPNAHQAAHHTQHPSQQQQQPQQLHPSQQYNGGDLYSHANMAWASAAAAAAQAASTATPPPPSAAEQQQQHGKWVKEEPGKQQLTLSGVVTNPINFCILFCKKEFIDLLAGQINDPLK